jgi:ATP/maltotriose-dependent transcriptional regulator MalT
VVIAKHLQNIYAKLGVGTRAAAVNRARAEALSG